MRTIEESLRELRKEIPNKFSITLEDFTTTNSFGLMVDSEKVWRLDIIIIDWNNGMETTKHYNTIFDTTEELAQALDNLCNELKK
ncbi:MAG: hypothetical protein WAW92_04570 [Minisyncoccia bacterium]